MYVGLCLWQKFVLAMLSVCLDALTLTQKYAILLSGVMPKYQTHICRHYNKPTSQSEALLSVSRIKGMKD